MNATKLTGIISQQNSVAFPKFQIHYGIPSNQIKEQISLQNAKKTHSPSNALHDLMHEKDKMMHIIKDYDLTNEKMTWYYTKVHAKFTFFF